MDLLKMARIFGAENYDRVSGQQGIRVANDHSINPKKHSMIPRPLGSQSNSLQQDWRAKIQRTLVVSLFPSGKRNANWPGSEFYCEFS
jgi:hypothetical protein